MRGKALLGPTLLTIPVFLLQAKVVSARAVPELSVVAQATSQMFLLLFSFAILTHCAVPVSNFK